MRKLESHLVSDERWRYVLSVEGRDFEFGEGEVTLGRSRTATVRIEHESVSRSHALLTFERGNALLKDLNSSNGTFVGGRRILNEARLSERETIQLGAAVLGFRVIAPPQPSERTAHIPTAYGTVPASVPISELLRPDVAEAGGGEMLEAPEVPVEKEKAVVIPPAPAEPLPLEISAGEMFIRAEQPEPKGNYAHDARAALEAVRNLPDAPLSSFRSPPPAPPPVRWSPLQTSSQPSTPSRPASISDFPIGQGAGTGTAAAVSARIPASFASRLLAALVDGVILSAINFLLLTPVLLIAVFLGTPHGNAGPRWEIVAITALSIVLILAADLWYAVGGLARSGRTPGKALLKIVVVGPDGTPGAGLGYRTALKRFLFQVIGSIPLCLGSLLLLFRKDGRAWHDLMAGTSVVKAP